MLSTREFMRAWVSILQGRRPALSIEITKECPLHCPGCYAFSPDHVGDGIGLKRLNDLRGDALVEGVMALIHRHRPLHVSLVGGDPLVRYREVEALVPRILTTGAFLQVVTSAFRPVPAAWAGLENFELVVSVDGLQPEHDRRRAPATYARILKHIEGQHAVVHCTITAAMARRGYLEQFTRQWAANPNVKKIWMSIFTPQIGETLDEIPSSGQRAAIIAELERLRAVYPKLDMPADLIAALRHPPASPAACIFARLTTVISADLKTEISPCQFGGHPDCARCGCYASMGLEAAAQRRLGPGLGLAPGLRAGTAFRLSERLGTWVRQHRHAA